MRRPSKAVLVAGVVLATVAGPAGAAGADPAGQGAGPAQQAGPDPRIVGGQPAAPGEFPYFVSVQFAENGTGDAFCGGSLLSTTKVLTAAHCVALRDPADLQVTIGGTTLTGSDVGVVRNVSAVAAHPLWSPSSFESDVAVLTLATPITRADTTVQWLRRALGNEQGLVDPGDVVTTVGHGSTSEGGPGSNQLLKVGVPIQADATMNEAYGSAYDDRTMIGAGPLEGGRDACTNDSGGPLVVTSTPQDIQVGVTSWGRGCAQPGFPGVYAQVHEDILAEFVDQQVTRPGNDQFAAATTLTGTTGTRSGSTENATVQAGEPGAETSVWYTWTPTRSGTARITVTPPAFDSEVAVFTGSAVTGLTQVARDVANGTPQSQVQFSAVAGRTYRIQVDGGSFDFGPFSLSYRV